MASRAKENVLSEVSGLIKQGYKEITLLGQNVNSYGKDLDAEYDFSDLLQEIDAIEGDYILRFMTSHPKDLSDELIEVMKESKKILTYILYIPSMRQTVQRILLQCLNTVHRLLRL